MYKARVWVNRVVAAATVLLIASLGWLCTDIYRQGEVHLKQGVGAAAFSREIVAQRLKAFGVPAAGYAALVAAALFLQAMVPAENTKYVMSPENKLRLMRARRASLPAQAEREERLRRKMAAASVTAISLCCAVGAGYLLNGENFVSWDLEAVIAGMLAAAGPWIAAAFALAWLTAAALRRSVLREIDIIRSGAAAEKSLPAEKKRKSIGLVRAMMIIAAVMLVVSGVLNGGARDVLVKAINICTECIGLG